jgi:hypothetical protein
MVLTYIFIVRMVGVRNAQRLTFRQVAQTVFPAHAQAPVDQFLARCPTAAQVAAVDSIVKLLFHSDPSTNPAVLACRESEGSRDLSAFKKRVYNSIRLLSQMQCDAELPWTSKTLHQWFADAADTVAFRDEISLSFCGQPSGVINLRTRGLAPNQTDRFIDPRLHDGVASFILLLIHETRHAEGFRHTCGTNADLRLTEMGAWGVQYSLDLWMADHTLPEYFSSADTDYRAFFRANAERIVQAYFWLQPTPAP